MCLKGVCYKRQDTFLLLLNNSKGSRKTKYLLLKINQKITKPNWIFTTNSLRHPGQVDTPRPLPAAPDLHVNEGVRAAAVLILSQSSQYCNCFACCLFLTMNSWKARAPFVIPSTGTDVDTP